MCYMNKAADVCKHAILGGHGVKSVLLSILLFAMMGLTMNGIASEPSVCASEPIQLNAWSVHVVAVETSSAMEGRSSTWFASAAQSLNATTPRGSILILR